MLKKFEIGIACKTDIGADGEYHLAYGRIIGEIMSDGIKMAQFMTPWGSIFEIHHKDLFDIESDEDKSQLLFFEEGAFKAKGEQIYAGFEGIPYNVIKGLK